MTRRADLREDAPPGRSERLAWPAMEPATPLAPASARARRRRRTSAVLALCLAAGIGTSAYAADDPADQKRKVDDQLADSRSNLSETSTALVEAWEDLKTTRGKLPGARQAAKDAQAAEESAQSDYEDASAALEAAQADERKAERDLKKTSSEITRTRESVADFAGQVYQQQGLGSLSVAVGAESPDEAVDRIVMAESVSGAQGDVLDELGASRADLVAKGDKLEALRQKTKDAKDTKESALADAREASSAADSAESDLEDLESRQSSQARTLSDEREKESDQVESLEAESDELADILAERARRARIREAEIREAREREEARLEEARRRAEEAEQSEESSSAGSATSDPNPAPPSGTGVLAAPTNGSVTSEYGLRFHPIWKTWRMHAGRDYAAGCGAPVYAAADGRIISALPPGSTGGYGNQIVIDHGVKDGVSLATTYNHMESFAVRSGSVKKGDVIGYEGTTGSSTGCHLHFEVRENGTAVDPRGWL